MNKRTAYAYSVLRYVHEAAGGEFLNVGVVLRTQKTHEVYTRLNSSLLRLQMAFPDCNTKLIRDQLTRLDEQINATGEAAESFEELLQSWLPEGPRGLQWSAPAAGVSANPARAVDDLFVSLVAKKGSAYERFDGALISRAAVFSHFLSIPDHRTSRIDFASNESEWQPDLVPRRIAAID